MLKRAVLLLVAGVFLTTIALAQFTDPALGETNLTLPVIPVRQYGCI